MINTTKLNLSAMSTVYILFFLNLLLNFHLIDKTPERESLIESPKYH